MVSAAGVGGKLQPVVSVHLQILPVEASGNQGLPADTAGREEGSSEQQPPTGTTDSIISAFHRGCTYTHVHPLCIANNPIPPGLSP